MKASESTEFCKKAIICSEKDELNQKDALSTLHLGILNEKCQEFNIIYFEINEDITKRLTKEIDDKIRSFLSVEVISLPLSLY